MVFYETMSNMNGFSVNDYEEDYVKKEDSSKNDDLDFVEYSELNDDKCLCEHLPCNYNYSVPETDCAGNFMIE